MKCAIRKSGIDLTFGWYIDVKVTVPFNDYNLLKSSGSKSKSAAITEVCYNKLFKLLIDKGMKKTEFHKAPGINRKTKAMSYGYRVKLTVGHCFLVES